MGKEDFTIVLLMTSMHSCVKIKLHVHIFVHVFVI